MHSVFCIMLTLIVFLIFLDEQFLAYNLLLTSRFTSYYLVVLLKQTCGVKSLSLPHVT